MLALLASRSDKAAPFRRCWQQSGLLKTIMVLADTMEPRSTIHQLGGQLMSHCVCENVQLSPSLPYFEPPNGNTPHAPHEPNVVSTDIHVEDCELALFSATFTPPETT